MEQSESVCNFAGGLVLVEDVVKHLRPRQAHCGDLAQLGQQRVGGTVAERVSEGVLRAPFAVAPHTANAALRCSIFMTGDNPVCESGIEDRQS